MNSIQIKDRTSTYLSASRHPPSSTGTDIPKDTPPEKPRSNQLNELGHDDLRSSSNVKSRGLDMSRAAAAVTIQRAWRAHIDVQVYRYYKNMINFRNAGDPQMMLKCINPTEAKLIDSASGCLVRFRLAGDRFPPNIYYKIYTKRPVQDLGANAPRNYTSNYLKLLPIKDQNCRMSRDHSKQSDDDKCDWYSRIENNGWRLVSERYFQNENVAFEDSQPNHQFHHNPAVRRDELEKKKKRRKIAWLKKMYQSGKLQATGDNEALRTLVDETAQGLVEATENIGPDIIENWEVDELLKWTNGLNFDDYFRDWGEIATTISSDEIVDQRHHFERTNDAFEFTVNKFDLQPGN